jgi:hypothetical protein
VTRKTLPPAVAKSAFATIQFTNDVSTETLNRDMDIAVETGISKQKGDLTGLVYDAQL